jgi:TorA maturation chaperone TorD
MKRRFQVTATRVRGNDSKEILDGFHETVLNWAKKYNVDIERLDKKPIYYILGVND